MILTALLLTGGAWFVGRRFEEPAKPSAERARPASAPPVREEVDEAERVIDHYLAVSATSLGLAVGGALVAPTLSLVSAGVQLYTAVPIIKHACRAVFVERRSRSTIVDSIAIVGATAWGFFVASSLSATLYYLSRKLLLKTEDRSRRALVDVFGERPRAVWIARDGSEIEVPFEEVRVGDVLVMRAGQVVPVDGTICEGEAAIDQHRLTGESAAAERGAGERVLASSLVLSGRICVEVEQLGAHTVAAQIGQMLDKTADYRDTLDSRGERIADRVVIPLLALGAVGLYFRGAESAIAILCSNYADNVRIAGPMAMLNFLREASMRGVLIKDGRVLELLDEADTVVFDKTGTLTLDRLDLAAIHLCHDLDESLVLAYAAAAEARQSHPIARAIAVAAAGRGLQVDVPADTRYQVGFGITALVDGRQVRIGSVRFMEREALVIPDRLHEPRERARASGATLVYVAVDDAVVAALELRSVPRPETRQIVDALRSRGLQLYILSGDQDAPTRTLAAELGIERYFAEVLPRDKAEVVARLQREGRKVCFVGDGLNDVVALKTAHASVSLAGATTIATDTAQVVLMDGTLRQLPGLFELGHAFNSNMRDSLVINAGAGALSVGGALLFNFGIYAAIGLYNFSLLASLVNAMSPAWRTEARPDPRPVPVSP